MTARLLGPDDAALWRVLWTEALAEAPAAFARRPEGSPQAAEAAVAARLASLRAFVWEACGGTSGTGAGGCGRAGDRHTGDGPDALDGHAAAAAAGLPHPQALACALWCRDADPTHRRRGWVEAVFVRRHARGRGIAVRLLAALAEDARAAGMAELRLEVGRANAPARAAYARAGYAPLAVPASRPDEIMLGLRLEAGTGPG